ncbi:MAG: enoyl-CoA hydratase/isomerase family protein [Chloroflexi bacterium]|nr:enoyl-CoA hydratase/isomerase family protein [Chloroflexota bacterium]
MQDDLILMEKKGSVCTLSLNRPERRNALCMELLQQLVEAINATNDDPSLRVIILRGAGDEAFSAGYDLAELPTTGREWSDRITTGEAILPQEDLLKVAVEKIINHRCPTIAMIYGPVMGGSCDLIAACDLRMAADTARFAIPAVKRGILYHAEGVQRLVALVGVAAAKEILLTGEFIDAQRAREIGLVNQVVAAENLHSATYSIASRLAMNAPLAVAGAKALISRLLKDMSPTEEDEKEINELMAKCFRSHDFQESLRAFTEKRAPKFEGR